MVYIVEVLLNTTVNFTICIPEIIDSEWNRHSSQMLAKVDEYGDAVKFEKPVIPAPDIHNILEIQTFFKRWAIFYDYRSSKRTRKCVLITL